MPVQELHDDYDGASKKWKRCRDAVAGRDAVHASGELYLPKLPEQEQAEYNAYKLRASYFNATGRTLEGLVGMVFRKPPQVVAPAGLTDIVEDMDLQGTRIADISQDILSDVMEVGRVGYLVEYPSVTEQPASQAAASQKNLRPYASKYPAESIRNWVMARVNNVMQPIVITLTETHSETVDEFSSKSVPQIRALLLTATGYIQRVYRENAKKEWVQIGGDIVPQMKGKALPFIPFYAFGPKANELKIQNAPILDLADLNLDHYRVTADYENICHYSGCPTLLLAGIAVKEGDKVPVGSASAIVTDQADAHGEYIEVDGNNQLLEKNLDRKQAQMAAIGARMLAPEKAGVESEGTLLMRSNGENSVLGSIAQLVSHGVSQMLAFMGEWEGVTGEATIQLNTDYVPAGVSPQMLSELTKALQSGAISPETYFYNLERGEMIAPGTDFDTEKEQIVDGGVPLGDNGNNE